MSAHTYQPEQQHLAYQAQKMAFAGGHVSVGQVVRRGGAAALVLGASQMDVSPEMRFVVISAIGVAASFAEMMARRHSGADRHGEERTELPHESFAARVGHHDRPEAKSSHERPAHRNAGFTRR